MEWKEGRWREKNLLGTLGKDDAELDLLVLDALGLLRTLEEGNIQNKAAGGGPAEEVLSVRVPADGEGVFPAAKERVSGLDLEQGLALVAAESRGRDVADDVGVVGVGAADAQGKLELLEGRGGALVVLGLLPLDAVEERREVGTAVVERVAVLKGDVAAPVADLDVALQAGDVGHGLVELEADRDGLVGSRRLLVEGPVGELGALLLGELGRVAGAGELGVVRDVGRGELDFGLLLGGGVDGGQVGREGVGQELGLLLFDGGGEGGVGLEEVVADAEGLRGAGTEGLRELDAEVLDVTVGD